MNDRYLKTGPRPFHPVSENPLLRLERDVELLVHPDRLNRHEAQSSTIRGLRDAALEDVHRRRRRAHARYPPRQRWPVAAYHNPFTVAAA